MIFYSQINVTELRKRFESDSNVSSWAAVAGEAVSRVLRFCASWVRRASELPFIAVVVCAFCVPVHAAVSLPVASNGLFVPRQTRPDVRLR
jgi:hypothetical protein